MGEDSNTNEADKYYLMGIRCLERDDFYNATQYIKRAVRSGHSEAKRWIEKEDPDRRIEAENQYKFGLNVGYKPEWAAPYMEKAAKLGHEKAQAWINKFKNSGKKKKRKKKTGKRSKTQALPELQPGSGYVYILINASLPKNYLKIGMTTRDPEIRAEELSNHSGVPGDYVVAYKKLINNCKLAEELVHRKLEQSRLTSQRNDRQREFFILPLHKAISVIDGICQSMDEGN